MTTRTDQPILELTNTIPQEFTPRNSGSRPNSGHDISATG